MVKQDVPYIYIYIYNVFVCVCVCVYAKETLEETLYIYI